MADALTGMHEPESIRGNMERTRNIHQLQALLLLLSDLSYEAFSLMGESSQQSVLALAYDLSLKAAPQQSAAQQ